METLSEGQKQNNPYTKNGDFSKQGEKNLYTQIIEVIEQESKEKITDKKALEITIYSSCCNAQKGIYYYTTYNNHQINAVDMNKVELDSENLVRYPVIDKESINYIN